MKLELFWKIFEKYSNIKFHENPSSRRGVVSCGEKDDRQTDGQIDMTKLIVTFHNFSNAPKKGGQYK